MLLLFNYIFSLNKINVLFNPAGYWNIIFWQLLSTILHLVQPQILTFWYLVSCTQLSWRTLGGGWGLFPVGQAFGRNQKIPIWQIKMLFNIFLLFVLEPFQQAHKTPAEVSLSFIWTTKRLYIDLQSCKLYIEFFFLTFISMRVDVPLLFPHRHITF